MRGRIGFVRANRRLVVVDRVEHVSVLEEQVPEVDQCARATFVGLERDGKRFERGRPVAERDERDAAFIVDRRPLGFVRRPVESACEVPDRRRVIAGVERDDPVLEGGLRAGPRP